MNLCIPRKKFHASQTSYFEKNLFFKYPCDLVESGKKCDIIVEIKDQPTDIQINHHMGQEYLPFGIYHLNRVPCTCSHSKILRQIEILFRKKVTNENCKVHNKEFDVYLRSNWPLSFKKI